MPETVQINTVADQQITADHWPGDGMPVVLAHGGGQTRHSWGGTAAALAAGGHRVVSIDLRGHGDSTWSGDGAYTMADYTLDADHPEIFASEDNGATPPELVLGALASCLTAGVASVATRRGVQLRSVTATIEGGMDIQGILGIDSDVRNGFDGITVTYAIDADASKADIEAIVAQSQKRSAVFDIVANPTTINVEVA